MSGIKRALEDYIEIISRDVMPLSKRWELQDRTIEALRRPESAESIAFYKWAETRDSRV